MKKTRLRRRCSIAALTSLVLCIGGGLVLGLAPVPMQNLIGVLVVCAVLVFSLSCTKWLDLTFESATGITLSAYYQTLYAGRQNTSV